MPRTIANAQRALLSALSIAALALTAGPAVAASGHCSAAEYRQLDFWLGNWKTYDDGGKGPYIARDEITATLDGCVVLEQYRQNDGHHGDGVTIYDASRGLWHQTWVTNYGELLILEGKFEGGVLTMSGSALDKNGKRVWSRVTWNQQSTGTHGVREIAVTSNDGGRSWKPAFDILFVKEQQADRN